MDSTLTNKLKINPVDSRLGKFKPRNPFEKEFEKKEILSPQITNKVYENQNGKCCQCNQSIYTIVKVRNAFSGETGFMGICERHSSNMTLGKNVIGIKSM